MRLLLVTDRYGPGDTTRHGQLARQFGTRLASRGHQVDVLAGHGIEAGPTVDGLTVYGPGPAVGCAHAAGPPAGPPAPPPAPPLAARCDPRVVSPLPVQEAWMAGQCQELGDVAGWLGRRTAGYDVVAFFGYRAAATWAGLPAAAGRVATVLHPLAADERLLYLPLFDTTLRHPTAFSLVDEEEATLLAHRLGRPPSGGLVGVGLTPGLPGDEGRFRQAVGLQDRPYLLLIGPPIGESARLLRYFRAYKARNPGPLALVVPARTGDGEGPGGEHADGDGRHPDVISAGRLDEETGRGAIDGALAVVRHAGYDGCSLDLADAWARCRPALINGWVRCLVEPAYRSRAAVIYWGFARFEAAVDLLVEDPKLGSALGAGGPQYVARMHDWDRVLDRYERLLEVVRARR